LKNKNKAFYLYRIKLYKSMKTNFLKFYLLVFFCVWFIHLNAQDDLFCKPLHEGSYEHLTETYRNGKHVVMFVSLIKDKQALTINKDLNSSPINVWDLENNKFIKMTHNWNGTIDDRIKVYTYDSSRFFLTWNNATYRADVNYNSKTIQYEKLFIDTLGNSKEISHFNKGKNNLYFVNNRTVFICNNLGQIKTTKLIELQSQSIESLLVAEINDSLFLSCIYHTNGHKMIVGVLDSNSSGNINIIDDEVNIWGNKRIFPDLPVFNGRMYVGANNTQDNIPHLYEYYKGRWKLLIIGAALPKYNTDGQLVLFVESGAYYFDNEVTNTKDDNFYEFFPETGKVGKIVVDPRNEYKDYEFDEDYYWAFFNRNDDFPDLLTYHKIGNKVIGFGNSIVAELINNNASNTQRIETSKISVYPNPIHHTINITGIESSEMYVLSDITGKTIMNGSTNGTIDISHLKSGVYLLTIQQQVVKIIK
jgi:hypothetical protein